MAKFVSGFRTVCRTKTQEAYVEHALTDFEKRRRTCLVYQNKFSQRFTRAGTGDVWVVSAKPEGECGVVNVSRWTPEIASGIKFWRYHARKVVTNKSATIGLGMTCGDLDEAEYLYDWRSTEKQVSCDYFKFSPI